MLAAPTVTTTQSSASSISGSSSRVTTSTIPVLIAGGGPVGLYEALLLTKLGIKCRIIERETSVSPLSKALGMHARSLEILSMTGLNDEFLKQGQPVREVSLWSGPRKMAAMPVVGSFDSRFSFGLILEQAKTSQIFIGELKKLGVQVDYGWELMDTKVVHEPHLDGGNTSYVETTIRRALSGDNTSPDESKALGSVEAREEQDGKEYEMEVIRSEYLVAADGGRSTVRHKLNIAFPGRTLDFKTLMCDGKIETNIPFSGINFFRGVNKKSMVFFPMSDGKFRMMVEDGDFAPGEDMIQSTKNVTLEYFEDLVKDALGKDVPFKILTNEWLTCYKVNERRAEHFIYKDRVFLAGDAAHIHSPAGGQGLNTGLQDAHNLAWKLALVLNKVAPPKLLNSYVEREPLADRAIKLSSEIFHRNRAQGFVADIKSYLFFMLALVSKILNLSFLKPEMAMLKTRYIENDLNRPHSTQPQPTNEFQRVGGRAGEGPIFEVTSDGESTAVVGKTYEKRMLNVYDDDGTIHVQQIIRGIARFHILVFTSDQLALSSKSAQAAKQLSQNLDRYRSHWRSRWTYGSSLNDGFEDQDLFKFHVIAGSVSTSSVDIGSLLGKGIGDGKLFVDATKSVYENYGYLWNRGQGGIVVVRPDSHIGYRVNGFEDEAWRDVDEYFGSILSTTKHEK
ncbi:hypothetical protein BGZ83_010635 [Gryganskiella cystojenkinii]|nr:hypothetical protein BGZ83_010635 [Gryganskiella cystojenkinii]